MLNKPIANSQPVALTCGELGGISGEITIKAWLKLNDNKQNSRFYLIAPKSWVADLCQQYGCRYKLISSPLEVTAKLWQNYLPVFDIEEDDHPLPYPTIIGKFNNQQGYYTIKAIEIACEHAIKFGINIITNPIYKKGLQQIGFQHQGHTDFIRDLCGAKQSVMMLCSKQLRVIPLTTHIALKDVSKTINQRLIETTVAIIGKHYHQDISIAVCGLNPHAGEEGMIGQEEQRIINPTIRKLQDKGVNIAGCFAADTLFLPPHAYDIYLCMYHDQALIPLKTLYFWDSVNITLGLPFLRASPDHGCAFDIAGKQTARADSLIAAISYQ